MDDRYTLNSSNLSMALAADRTGIIGTLPTGDDLTLAMEILSLISKRRAPNSDSPV